MTTEEARVRGHVGDEAWNIYLMVKGKLSRCRSEPSEDERRVIALLRDTDLMVRETYGFEMEGGTVRDDFVAHCTFLANTLERLLNANRDA
jgi:hypothetical protein